MNKSVTLIGMPGSGKSTLGPVLAAKLGYSFVDTDQIITFSEGLPPKEIVCQRGLDTFLSIQDDVVLKLAPERLVISTGGGIIHSNLAIEFLRNNTIVIFLDTPMELILDRAAPGRRFAVSQGKSLQEIHRERYPIYASTAHISVSCGNMEPEKILELIIEQFKKRGFQTQ